MMKNNMSANYFDDNSMTNNPYSEKKMRTPQRFGGSIQREPDLFDFERGGPMRSAPRMDNPNNQFMNGIRQEREQVMMDIDRRNHRRENFAGSPGSNFF
jgi:hypothetical protein